MFRSALRLKTLVRPAVAQVNSIARLHAVPELPYKFQEGVKPLLSAEALKVVYGEHQTDLINRLNRLIAGTPYESKLYYEVIMDSAASATDAQIFNNASQAWNNDFFLRSLTPNKKEMSERLRKALADSFGNVETFEQEFKANALGLFGSGWTWLVEDQNQRLVLLNTYNAGTPHHRRRQQRFDQTSTDLNFAKAAQDPRSGNSTFSAPLSTPSSSSSSSASNAAASGLRDGNASGSYMPILCVSMWEHAYLTDYGVTRTGREKYLDNFFKTVDWDTVEARIFRVGGF
ncbi:hypothetical protein DFQ27_002393 [Actinomortierella ambigua]|uniref:superoxide dismutase n=1 Tax=Actinomortierella ambigua TaxID=1343610 RepID=A0A9P6UCW7_9FUNG|nr:hypothetical protein DFQ27_002393 [Actinomortierella ambigua]